MGYRVVQSLLRNALQVSYDLATQPGEGTIALDAAGDAKPMLDIQSQVFERAGEIALTLADRA